MYYGDLVNYCKAIIKEDDVGCKNVQTTKQNSTSQKIFSVWNNNYMVSPWEKVLLSGKGGCVGYLKKKPTQPI